MMNPQSGDSTFIPIESYNGCYVVVIKGLSNHKCNTVSVRSSLDFTSDLVPQITLSASADARRNTTFRTFAGGVWQ